MTDRRIDSVRQEFSRLTALIEDAAVIASVGQGIDNVEDGRRQFDRLSKALDRIGRRLRSLEKLLG